MDIQLNSKLDVSALKKDFARRNRLQIREILNPDAAERIHECLIKETPWLIGFRDGDKDRLVRSDYFDNLPPQEMQALQQRVLSQAQEDFEFIYSSYPLMDENLKKQFPDLFLYRVVEFINSPPMLDFIKKVTGIEKLVRADAQATWYRRQHFLTLHNDYDPSDGGKRVAYVLSFAREWRPDWGGFLQFYDEEGNIEDGFMPRFNALSIFKTPQNHSVSYITPFAGQKRVAITGWFRDR